ncbi:MAG: hypothetical protein JXR61_05195 [Prolixibacteraceae bacterium]|nr:hypothetical protein [Prolixibacteraceae bacterium]
MKRNRKMIYALLFFILLFRNASIACTIVSCSLNGEVYAAANEDDFTPFSRIWFNPGTPERYGSVCFGAPDLQIGAAMNEYGLFYDFTAQYGIDPSKFDLKHPYNGDVMFELLGKCKTVDEALAFLEEHNYTAASQVLIADATGNSVILHVGVQVRKNVSYQINTNFDIANLATSNYTCSRYDISENILSNAKSVSVPLLKNLLNQTHQEGELSTQYSNIYDLKRGIIYVYLFHDFENVYVIDLKKELSKGYRLEMLAEHFPVSFAYQTYMQNHPLYKKEKIMSEIKNNGLTKTIDKYISEIKNTGTSKDSTLNITLIDVGIQLIKDAHNQHQYGSMWEYFFSLENGYKIIHYTDVRLEAATKLFNALLQEPWNDIKLKNFVFEMVAYIDLLEGRKTIALEKYQNLAENSSETFPVTKNRSREMLNRLLKEN